MSGDKPSDKIQQPAVSEHAESKSLNFASIMQQGDKQADRAAKPGETSIEAMEKSIAETTKAFESSMKNIGALLGSLGQNGFDTAALLHDWKTPRPGEAADPSKEKLVASLVTQQPIAEIAKPR